MQSMNQGEIRNNSCGNQARSQSPCETTSLQLKNEEKIDGRPLQPKDATSKVDMPFNKAPWDKCSTRAEKLNAMTPEDRIHGLYDLHCVSAIVPESPKYMATKLDELDVCLKNCSNTVVADANADPNESVYQNNPQVFENYTSKVRLQFLRAERFDAAKAAVRIERYFQVKRELFGNGSISRDLIPNDLSEDDWMHVRTGYIQVLSERDKKGRAVVFILGRLSMQIPVETSLRILFFLSNAVAATDESVQKSGVVIVYYAIGQEFFSRDHATKCLELSSALPVRIEAAHACYDDPALEPFFDIVSQTMTSECLVRFRSHFGTDVECQSFLMPFGIPIDKTTFPLRSDGTVNLINLSKWFQRIGIEERALSPNQYQAIGYAAKVEDEGGGMTTTMATLGPSSESNNGEVLVPTPFDVIMGRGRRGQRAAGNQHYRQLLLTYRSKYESANNFEKTLVAELVLKIMKERGCRFLKKSDDAVGWVEVSDEVAREKISHAFRNLRGT